MLQIFYLKHDLNDESYSTLVSLEKFIGPLDAYCIQCEQDSVFKQEKHIQIKPVFHGVEVDEASKQIRDPEYFKIKKGTAIS